MLSRIHEGIAAHRRGENAIDPLTGEELAPISEREVDEETGWFLDFFSPRELARAASGKSVLAPVALKLVLSLAATVFFGGIAAASVESLSTQPGLSAVLSVVAGGFSLTSACFHALRVGKARTFGVATTERSVIEAHLRSLQDRPRSEHAE